jgi:hypothetical protein
LRPALTASATVCVEARTHAFDTLILQGVDLALDVVLLALILRLVEPVLKLVYLVFWLCFIRVALLLLLGKRYGCQERSHYHDQGHNEHDR